MKSLDKKQRSKDPRKRCKLCGRYFTPKSRWNWFCKPCRDRAARIDVLEYAVSPEAAAI